MRVLVVEDEAALARTLTKSLTEETFAVDVARDGDEALDKLTRVNYDAAVLDLMLPGRDGWSVLQEARARGITTPVLILTARETVADRVKGLNLGADDYLLKPFALAELVARLRSLIRRAYGRDTPLATIGSVVVDSSARRVFRDGVPIDLTAREYAILEHLVHARGRLITRAALYEHLYGEDEAVESNVIDVYIASLRRKLGSDIVRTRRGEGYLVDA